MIIKNDKKYKFKSMFDPKTGFYMRTGILDENGKDTGKDPFMSSYPELLDIGIMQTCVCSGKCQVDCYQKACDRTGENMSTENFKKIIEQSKGKLFQCLEENEVVLIKNSNGYIQSKRIVDVNIGDIIYCGNNNFAKITEKVESNSEVYDIELNYGKHILATKEHRFPTLDGLKAVEELSIGNILLNTKNNFITNKINKIDVVKLILEKNFGEYFYLSECPGLNEVCKKYNIYQNSAKTVRLDKIAEYLPEIDYSKAQISFERIQYRLNTFYDITDNLMLLLGHYVGNGSKRSYTVNSSQEKMIERIEAGLKEIFPNFKYNKVIKNNTCKIELSSNLLHKWLFDKILECRTIANEKQLPNFIFSLTNEHKLAFLQGYFCDGNFKTSTKDGNYGSITFNTSSEKLYKDICLLLASMNVDYSVSFAEPNKTIFSKSEPRIINRKKRYRISVSNLNEIKKIQKVVSDHKNAKKFNDVINASHDDKYLRDRKDYEIKSITKLDKKYKVIDININSEDHLFITSHGIITHNCALGGAGDVDTHENFEEILKICCENNIVPNFTTSGILMNEKKAQICKKYCGAVAVSQHSKLRKVYLMKEKKDIQPNEKDPDIYVETFANINELLNDNWYLTDEIGTEENWVYKEVYFEEEGYTYNAIKMLLDAGVKTSIHYVLSKKSIDEAIIRLKNNAFPKGINAVVFLLYKPVGLGKEENVLNVNDKKVKEFFNTVDNCKTDFKIGFDSCTCPGIVNFTKNIQLESIDFCEGGRFSAYIDANMNMMPCSFANQDSSWHTSLNNHTIEEVWNNEIFNKFRYSLNHSCQSCKNRDACGGGCPLVNQITLCNKKERNFKQI